MIMIQLLNKINTFLLKNPLKYIILIAVLFRLIIFFIFYTTVTIYQDSEGFTDLAKVIASLTLDGYSGLRSPGYPLLIALLNQNLYLVVFTQFFMGIVVMALWYKTLINFNFQRQFSFYCTLFIGSFLNVIFFETAILVESFALFLIAIIVYLYSKDFFEKTNFLGYLLLSFLFGFLVLIKPFFAYLPFVFVAFLLLKKVTFKRLFYNLVLASFSLVAYFGWSYINKMNTGYFAPTAYYGLTNAQTCVYFAEKTPEEWNWISEIYVKYREKSIAENKDVSMSIWYAYEDGAYDKYNLTFPELSQELGKFAKIAIQLNPGEYIYQITCRTWVDFWKPAICWNYKKFNFLYANKIFLVIWYIQYAVLLLFELAFLLLVLPYSIYKFFKSKQISTLLLLTMIVFGTSVLQAIVTYGTNDRYSFPFEFIIIITVFLYLKEKGFASKYLNSSQKS